MEQLYDALIDLLVVFVASRLGYQWYKDPQSKSKKRNRQNEKIRRR